MKFKDLELEIRKIEKELSNAAAILVTITDKTLSEAEFEDLTEQVHQLFTGILPDLPVIVIPDTLKVEMLPAGEKVVKKIEEHS